MPPPVKSRTRESRRSHPSGVHRSRSRSSTTHPILAQAVRRSGGKAADGNPSTVRNPRYTRSSSRCGPDSTSSDSTGERPAFVVPAAYLYRRFGVDYTLVKDVGETVVQTGLPVEDGVEVLSGLRPGDVLLPPPAEPAR